MRRRKKSSPLSDWDRRFLWHPFTQMQEWEKEEPIIIEGGKGSHLIDINGTQYLDGTSSIWVNLHGHRHPVLDRALKTQLKKIAHSTLLGLSNPPAIRLARELIRIAPKGLSRV
ncbi:MAG TPA: aminotransferase class III-fold pyridoxal phosphate-dependent enzyme, partial [Nitrospira sp.]|nr:aminotransferase class III-fold pyridoxal phosphate-dependent enzyme [Nitrospira sp.]